MAKEDTNTTDLLSKLVDKLTEAAQAAALKPSDLEAILTRAGLSSAEAMRGKLAPENQTHPGKSAFSYPEGDVARPKPELARKTYFCGMEERADRLTPAEIDGYNALKQSTQARNGRWTAKVRVRGEKEELWVDVPANTVDQRMDLPPLVLILHELAGGPSTEDIGALVRQIDALKAMVMDAKRLTPAQLEAQLNA